MNCRLLPCQGFCRVVFCIYISILHSYLLGILLFVSPCCYWMLSQLQHFRHNMIKRSLLQVVSGLIPEHFLHKYFHLICLPQRLHVNSIISSVADLAITHPIKGAGERIIESRAPTHELQSILRPRTHSRLIFAEINRSYPATYPLATALINSGGISATSVIVPPIT